MSEEQELKLVTELVSDDNYASKGEIDNRKMGIFSGPTYHPKDFRAIVLLSWAGEMLNMKAMRMLHEAYVVHTIGIDGLGRKQVLKAQQILQGNPVSIDPAPERPGFLDKLRGNEKSQEYEQWKQRQELDIE